ncbi:collagen alpha-1(I) chain-like [Choloepus didactylus]|uniref:collagen alpha-1(I) chain-like n=1 Tax=Choloepus didactylus TaxID=27675 RepID=UPI0018A11818|nr:collagen alpha-1(I) chain-like [Choloepus didactylus]
MRAKGPQHKPVLRTAQPRCRAPAGIPCKGDSSFLPGGVGAVLGGPRVIHRNWGYCLAKEPPHSSGLQAKGRPLFIPQWTLPDRAGAAEARGAGVKGAEAWASPASAPTGPPPGVSGHSSKVRGSNLPASGKEQPGSAGFGPHRADLMSLRGTCPEPHPAPSGPPPPVALSPSLLMEAQAEVSRVPPRGCAFGLQLHPQRLRLPPLPRGIGSLRSRRKNVTLGSLGVGTARWGTGAPEGLSVLEPRAGSFPPLGRDRAGGGLCNPREELQRRGRCSLSAPTRGWGFQNMGAQLSARSGAAAATVHLKAVPPGPRPARLSLSARSGKFRGPRGASEPGGSGAPLLRAAASEREVCPARAPGRQLRVRTPRKPGGAGGCTPEPRTLRTATGAPRAGGSQASARRTREDEAERAAGDPAPAPRPPPKESRLPASPRGGNPRPRGCDRGSPRRSPGSPLPTWGARGRRAARSRASGARARSPRGGGSARCSSSSSGRAARRRPLPPAAGLASACAGSEDRRARGCGAHCVKRGEAAGTARCEPRAARAGGQWPRRGRRGPGGAGAGVVAAAAAAPSWPPDRAKAALRGRSPGRSRDRALGGESVPTPSLLPNPKGSEIAPSASPGALRNLSLPEPSRSGNPVSQGGAPSPPPLPRPARCRNPKSGSRAPSPGSGLTAPSRPAASRAGEPRTPAVLAARGATLWAPLPAARPAPQPRRPAGPPRRAEEEGKPCGSERGLRTGLLGRGACPLESPSRRRLPGQGWVWRAGRRATGPKAVGLRRGTRGPSPS